MWKKIGWSDSSLSSFRPVFGVAYSKCNLRARTTNFLPVFFHNLSRYDAHLILKHLNLKVGEELSAIAETDGTHISFSINIPACTHKKQSGQLVKLYQSLRFLDSYQFVSQSLENLVKTLKKRDFFYSSNSFTTFRTKFFSRSRRFFSVQLPRQFRKVQRAFSKLWCCLEKVSLVKSILLILTTTMQSVFTMIFVAKTWENITTCIQKLMCFF